MTARLPRDRAVRPPDNRLGAIAPRVKCPSGKRRYQTEDTANAHHRVSMGGSVAVACERCGGWHHARREDETRAEDGRAVGEDGLMGARSQRDVRIVDMLSDGATQEEVARAVGVRQSTVSKVRARALREASAGLKRAAIATALAEEYRKARTEVAERFAVRLTLVESIARKVRP